MILDYRKVSCGCCTGKTVEQGANWRKADDQCVCWMHQDSTRGMPQTVCSVHLKPRGPHEDEQ